VIPLTIFPDFRKDLNILTSNLFTDNFDVLIANTDTLDFLKTVPDRKINLVVTSPPYNIGKVYEKKLKLQDYLNWQFEVIKECHRILVDGGSLCWEVGNYIESGEVFPLDIYFYNMIKQLSDFKLRNRIIWYFEHGLHSKKRLSGRYETILWFTKGDNYTFNLDLIRVPQKYPGKRNYKGENKGAPSCNPLGKNPSDVWKVLEEDWNKLIWDIPNVKANHPEKTIHPAQFPIELVERLVLALTNENDIVLDPFMGVGSTIVASILHNRRAIGIDKEKIYVDIAIERINSAISGVLKRRYLGTPKYEPSGREKVAQVPLEWLNDIGGQK